MDKKIKEYSKKYKLLVKQISLIEEKIEMSNNAKEKEQLNRDLLKINDEFDLLIVEYSKIIFDVYSKKNSQIKDTYTGEIISWDKHYGRDFSELSKLKREGLVGLIEKYGAYILIK